MKDAKIRLFVTAPLQAGQAVALDGAQANYLFNVMRLARGAQVLLFNGADGEWRAEVAEAGKRGGILICAAQTAPLRLPPDLWLLFAPLKKARTDFVVEKSVEMGAARICPVQTQHTNADRIRRDKMLAHAVEAAEQCGATFVPQVEDLVPLDRVLQNWPADRALFWADEALAGQPLPMTGDKSAPAALLIGPEGGFSDAEKTQLRALPFVRPFSLGPRILRAETAVVAALTLWQVAMGDWG
ncbi:MAG: 16S rRNA (uracil(1498)-N(3))-methyltransferase [Cypionkella sp.]|nr:16S rRNA (uracil(1498)-N(3))-methyltransferase [Cypionkella sp.]